MNKINIPITKADWFWFLLYIILLVNIWMKEPWYVALLFTCVMWRLFVHDIVVRGFGKMFVELRKKNGV